MAMSASQIPAQREALHPGLVQPRSYPSSSMWLCKRGGGKGRLVSRDWYRASHGPKQGSGKSTQHPCLCNAIRLRSSLSASIHPINRFHPSGSAICCPQIIKSQDRPCPSSTCGSVLPTGLSALLHGRFSGVLQSSPFHPAVQ